MVVAMDKRLHTQIAKILDEVVGKAVVIINQNNHGVCYAVMVDEMQGCWYARPMTRTPPKKPPKRVNPLKPKRDAKGYFKFVAIAIILLLLADHFLWGGERPYITKMKQDYYAEQAAIEAQEREKMIRVEQAIADLLPPVVVYPDDGSVYFEAPPPVVVKEEIKPEPVPTLTGKRPKIAIVIDDVGMNLRQSQAVINLDPNVTLALLPYADTVRELAVQARAKGHEIIIHTPMEAMNSSLSLGALALRKGMSEADFTAEFQKILENFDGYVGVNNHMGSRLTQDKPAMEQLMQILKSKGLYFLDSKTIATSVAGETAELYGVPFAVRDVFLDHEETPEFVVNALKKTERIARDHGSAIAIGHPKANTVAALKAWIPTLKDKGFDLVPLSALVE